MGYNKKGYDFFTEAYNSIIDEFMQNQEMIFRNQNERIGLFYPIHHRKMKEWKMSRKCVYENCSENSVKKSHSITQNTFLSIISEDGHVFGPGTHFSGETVMKRVGINEASTFPGFCKKHEQMFHGFEQRKKLEKPEEIYKQMYRTVCREIVIREHRLSIFEEIRNKYVTFRSERLLALLKEKPFVKFLESTSNFKLEGFDIGKPDYLDAILKREIKSEARAIKNLRVKFLNKIHNELEGKLKTSRFMISNINYAVVVPVALSGNCSFWIKKENWKRKIKVEFLVNVLPSENATNIYILSLKRYKKHIWYYLIEFLSKDFGFLSLIETWMIHGPDHWFVKPSVWESITITNQKRILERIINETDITKPFSKSIFNKVRREAMLNLKGDKTAQEFDTFLRNEMEKLTDYD